MAKKAPSYVGHTSRTTPRNEIKPFPKGYETKYVDRAHNPPVVVDFPVAPDEKPQPGRTSGRSW